MKITVICVVLCMMLTPGASAQTGGYPASPSHGVVGTNPDGTPRYGGEPGNDANRSSRTMGSSNSSGNRSAPNADDPAKQQRETPQRDR